MRKQIRFAALALAAASLAFAQAGWTKLFDGKTLNGFTPIGDAMWKVADGSIEGSGKAGFLVTNESYKDFEMKLEFWVDDSANSGVFIRCTNPKQVTPMNSYEVNIYDTRPDPKYATGAIVDVASPSTVMKAGGKWNTYEITARGSRLMVTLNGVKTVDAMDSKFAEGPIALQYGSGVVKFRNVQIRRL